MREAHEVVKEESRDRKKEAVEIFMEEIGREEEKIEEVEIVVSSDKSNEHRSFRRNR